MHPLATLDAGDDTLRRLDAMAASGEVVAHALSSPSLRIYKYTDPQAGETVPTAGLRGLARGLVMNAVKQSSVGHLV